MNNNNQALTKAIEAATTFLTAYNNKRKITHGVHQASLPNHPGESTLRYYALHNPEEAKAIVSRMIKESIAMKSKRFLP